MYYRRGTKLSTLGTKVSIAIHVLVFLILEKILRAYRCLLRFLVRFVRCHMATSRDGGQFQAWRLGVAVRSGA